MTVRFRYVLATLGLWMTPSLPALCAAEPARLAIEPGRPQSLDPNQQMADTIAAHLRQSGQLRHYRIDIAFRAGTVEVSGQVADEAQRHEALLLVRSVEGVGRVVDRLTVAGAGGITPVQADAQPPREPQQLPRVPTPVNPAPAGPVVEPMPLIAGQGALSPYDLHTPRMPPYAWPTYAPYNNYSRVAYPQAYPYNAWPFIGPMYPFPKIPLGWRKVQLEWQDGHWWFSKLATPYDWWRIRYW